MVRFKHFIFLIVLFQSSFIFAQNNVEYPELNKYSRFGFSVGGLIFKKAQLTHQYGSYSIQTQPIPSYSFGITYSLPIYKNWSFETGLFFAKEPSIYAKYSILQKDLPDIYSNNISDKASMYVSYAPSIPLSIQYNLKISHISYLHCQVGMKAMLLRPSALLWLDQVSINDSINTSVFGLKTETPDAYFLGSFTSGLGYSIAFKNLLLRATFSYTANFQNSSKGYYKFLNLRESADSGGNYILSGDHFAFTITANFKKFKKRLEKEKIKLSN